MNIQDIVLAKRYAASYMRSGKGERIEKKRNDIREIFPELAPYVRYLSHPCVSTAVKFELLSKVLPGKFKNSPAENFLKILIDSKRISLLGAVMREVENFYNEAHGIEELDVYSRFELSEGETAALEKVFAASTGKKIIVKKELKPELIGGIQIRFRDLFIDNSLRTSLGRMKKSFLN